MLDEISNRLPNGCSLASGLHSYTGDESQLKFRLLFTDRELLAKRPSLRSTKNKIISENRDKQGGKRQQQDEDQSRETRSSERVNNNELLSHHSSFIIEQKQGRWEIEAEIVDAKQGRRGCKLAELDGGLRLRLYASTRFSCKLPINGTSPTGCRGCSKRQDERGASSGRASEADRPQNKEEGNALRSGNSLDDFQSQPRFDEPAIPIIGVSDRINLSPSLLNKSEQTAPPIIAKTTTTTTMRERAFNWKDTATVTSDSNDRQRTLARKLPYEIRNQQLEHCNHRYSFTSQHGRAVDFSGADMDLSCGGCITGLGCCCFCCHLFDGGAAAVKELLRAPNQAPATREGGPIKTAEEDADYEGVERTDWYQECLLNGKRDLAFTELASVAASAGFADPAAGAADTSATNSVYRDHYERPEWSASASSGQLGDGKVDDAIGLENSGRAPRPAMEILYVLMEIMEGYEGFEEESSGIQFSGKSQLKLNAKSRTDTGGADTDATDGLIARSNWDKTSHNDTKAVSVAANANANANTNDDDRTKDHEEASQLSRDRRLANNAVKMELKRPGDSLDMDDTDDRGDKGASMIVAEIAAGASDRLEPPGRNSNNERLDASQGVDSQTRPDRAVGSLVATGTGGAGDDNSNSARWMQSRHQKASGAGLAKASLCLAAIVVDRLNRFVRLKPDLNELVSVDIYNELELYQAGLSACAAGSSSGGSSDRSRANGHSEIGLEPPLQQRHPPHHPQRRPNASREGVLALLKLPLLYQLKLAVAEPAPATTTAAAAVEDDDEMRHRGLGGVVSSSRRRRRRRSLLTKEEAEHALSLIYNKLLNKELAWKRLQATSKLSAGSNKWFMMGQEIPEKTATAPPFISPLNGNQLIMLQFDFHFASQFNNDCGNLYVKYKLLLKDNPASSKWKLIPRTKGVGAKQENSAALLLLARHRRQQQRQPQMSSSIKLNVAHDDNRSMPNEIDMNYYVEATKKTTDLSAPTLPIAKRAAGRNQTQISHQEPANEGLADTKTDTNTATNTNAANTNANTNTNTNTDGGTSAKANAKQLTSALDASTSRLGISGNPMVAAADQVDKSTEHSRDGSRLISTQQPNQPAVLLEGSTVTSRPDGVGRFQFGCLERLVFEVADRQDGATADSAAMMMMMMNANTANATSNAPPAAVNRLKRRLAANKAPRLISSLLAPLNAKTQKSLESPNNNEIDNFLASGDRYADLDNEKQHRSSNVCHDKDGDDDSVKRANYATKSSSSLSSSLSKAAAATKQIAIPERINGSKAASHSIQANRSGEKSRFNSSERTPPDQVDDGGIEPDNNHEINKLDKPAVLTPAQAVHVAMNKTSAGPSGIERLVNGEQPRRAMEESASFPGKPAETLQADDEHLELLLLLEFYSSNFYHDKLQGWSHLSLPICLSRQQAHRASCCVLSDQNDRLDNTDFGYRFSRQRQAALAMPTAGAPKCNRTRHVLTVIRPELQSIRDKLRYYLIGELPSSTPSIESVSSQEERL